MTRRLLLAVCRIFALVMPTCWLFVAEGRTASAEKYPTVPNPPSVTIPNPPSVTVPSAPNRPLSPVEASRQEDKKQEAARAEIKEIKDAFEEFQKKLQELLQAFGPDARYGFTDNFIVIYDTTDAYAFWCATLLENVANAYAQFVSYSSFVENSHDDPMVLFIFAKKEDYEAYISKTASSSFDPEHFPAGLYCSGPNQAIFYDVTGREKTLVDNEEAEKRKIEEVASEILATPEGKQNISTSVHEGTHLISHNWGLFSREGLNPTWAVEGLAMLFETPSGDAKDCGWKIVDVKTKKIHFPINEARVKEFQQYVLASTDQQPVKLCVGLEEIRGEVPYAYPVSWALFHYLYRYYPERLASYLANAASMQPRIVYSSKERVYEFMNFFGENWDGLYLELRAFVDGLELQLQGIAAEEAERRARAKYKLPDSPDSVLGLNQSTSKKSEKKSSTTSNPKKRDSKASGSNDEEGKQGQSPSTASSKASPSGKKPTPSGKPTTPSKKSPSEDKKSTLTGKATSPNKPNKKSPSEDKKSTPTGKATSPSKKSSSEGKKEPKDLDWLNEWEDEEP